MSPPSASQVARKCLDHGVGSLSADEQSALKQLFLKEARKGAFTPRSQEGDLQDFCRHVEREFAATATVLAVVDFQPMLRQRARELAAESIPLAALVLYATWLEHWLNMVITVALLRNGASDDQVKEFFFEGKRLKRFHERLDALGPQIGTTALNEKVRGQIIQLVRTRHRYVHYEWRGRLATWLAKDLAGVRSIVAKAETLLDELLEYEHDNFDKHLLPMAKAMFPGAVAG